MSDADIDLIVVNYKTYDLLARFIQSYDDFKPSSSSTLTVIDVEGSIDLMMEMPATHMTRVVDDNIGYARACNMGAALTRGRNIGFFNADTRFINDDCVDYCVNFLDENPETAIVGPLQYGSGGHITHAGIFGTHERPRHAGWQQKVRDDFRENKPAITVSGSAYFVRRSTWDELTQCGLYQDVAPNALGAFLPTKHWYEETFCSYHAHAHDYQVWYLGEAEMIHEWHKSSPVGSISTSDAQAYFRKACDHHGIPHD
jgi:GT2 family glycosyltransferase